jgi:hypothetical protein
MKKVRSRARAGELKQKKSTADTCAPSSAVGRRQLRSTLRRRSSRCVERIGAVLDPGSFRERAFGKAVITQLARLGGLVAHACRVAAVH